MSIIGLVGPACSGKETLVNYLRDRHGYRVVQFQPDTDISEKSLEIYNSWRIPTVVHPIQHTNQLKILRKRSYFHLIYLDSPINLRYRRHLKKERSTISFQEFVEADDRLRFDKNYQTLISKCKVHLNNSLLNAEKFLAYLDSEIYKIMRPFRPNWDVYFMKIAYTLKQRSNCMKKSVGAVLVDKHFRILSTSYNGTPKVMKNCNEGGCIVCKEAEGLDLILYKCLCIHAEEGCILEKGVSQTRGTVLYTTLFPCVWCCKALQQAGVAKIIYGEQGNWDLSLKFLNGAIAYEKVAIDQFIY